MIGLEKEIRNKKQGRKSKSNEKFSCKYIAELLGKSYNAVSMNLRRNSFTVTETIGIFKTLVPADKQTIDFYIYLFTEQN